MITQEPGLANTELPLRAAIETAPSRPDSYPLRLRLLPFLQQTLENLIHHVPRLGVIQMDLAGRHLSVNDPDASHAQPAKSFQRTLQALDVALATV
jgi:hypothetical protein